MILVIENRREFDARTAASPTPEPARCTLQQTLRRLGFYAARPPSSPPRPALRRR